MKTIKKSILLSALILSASIIQAQTVNADTISAGSGNRIHFINTKANSGSDAILLESNGHYALIDMGEDYDFPDGTDTRYPNRWGISINNYQVLEDRLIRHLDQLGVKKLDFILGTHVHSDHIGGADEILNRYQVDKFYLKKYSDQRITSTWGLWDNLFNYDNALRAAHNKGVTLIQDIKDEDSKFKFGDMDIQLYNYKNEYDADGNLKRVLDDNSNSIVAVVTVAGKRIYLGGDLDNAEGAEDKLGPVIGKVDMMKWNHHYDAKVSNTIGFIEHLSPSMIIQTTGGDINLASTRDYLKNKNIQVIHASSKTQDATVFDISDKGFTNVSGDFPNIPTVEEKWYKEDGYWKYRLKDGQMAIGWHDIAGATYFFNGKGQMQSGRWLRITDEWNGEPKFNDYYLNNDGKMQTGGWFYHDNTWYYIQSNGARRYNELAEIGGQKYLFDKDGKMLTGLQVFNGKKMLFASSGALQTEGTASSWQKIDGNWYYFDEEGTRIVGKKEINGATYYFNQEGMMQTGWIFTEGHWNYFASSGAMKTGWVKDKGTWYYLEKDGVMLTGLQEIDGTRYYLNASGAMQTGWKWLDNHYYYFTTSGSMKTGWLKDKELWYYLDKDGIMLTGLQEIDGTRYYLNTSGAMQIGWKWLDNHYYYFATSGAMKTGWFKDKGLWYYLKPEDGVMATGLLNVDGTRYYLNASGAMETGWQLLDNQYYYFTESGAMKTGWFKDKGLWYYLKPEDGVMATGLLDVDGTRYYLNASGAMQTGWKQLNGNWYYFQADGSLLRNGTTPDGYKVNQDGIWSLNPDKVEVQGSQEKPKKDSDKLVEKEEKSAEVNEKDEAAETKPTLKADKE
ncbi:MBL fold metallo-hydrolase [Streptococcus pseudopneumoniae]|uniref:MBL fold metallo-hydrolase n=1 Tax=Streptococcus pseudopneumoniae TaxID=257758 RepID=UPI00066B389F|nr:MBL fold metallo-hydrolase [Streptococcus pseudopneumoniae]